MAAAPPKKRKTAPPASFSEGDRVECFFRDWEQYFPATVSRMNDDLTYDVDYDDGYAEKNLPAKLLKPPKPFRVGDKVDARFRGWRTFYPGTIDKVHSASLYDVAYDDGYTETDVSSKYIRPRLEAAKAPQVVTFEFSPGDRVAARYQGGRKRYAATVVAQRHDGTYDVAYDDGDAEGGVEARLLSALAKEVDVQAKSQGRTLSEAAGELRVLISSSSFKPTRDAKKVDQICESWGAQLRPTATSLLLLCACRSELTTTAKTLVEKCDALVHEEQADGLSAVKVARIAGNERFLKALCEESTNDRPTWVLLETEPGKALARTASAKRLLRRPSLGPEVSIDANDRAAARVVADALVLRHALGDASEALARSSVARAVAFDVFAVDAVESCRDAVAAFVDALPGALHTRERGDVVSTVRRRAAHVLGALGAAPKRPPRPETWPSRCVPPGIYRADRNFESVDVADGTLRDKLTVRPMAASWGGEDDLEVIAAERIEAGESAPYSGILGKANELATATKLAPKDQMAFWRFLISVDDDIVLLPFVDPETNPVCFINDAFGPARSSPDDEIWPNVRFQASGEGACVVALRRIEKGETLWIDYGDAFWAFRDDLDDVSRRLVDAGSVVRHLEAWAQALNDLPHDAELPPSLVKRLRGEFTVSQRALRGEQNKGGRLREPTALSLARDALPRSSSSSPRPPRKRARSPTPPADAALEAMTGAQLRKLMARQGVGAAPVAWAADVRSLLREVRALEDGAERVSLEDVRPAIAARGFTWTGSLPLNGTRCVISVPPAWPCYLDAWGADNSHARGCKKYIRSMASLVGYLEKCLELARDGVSVRLEGDTAASDDEANASDDATPPSVAPSQADEAEIEQARAKLLGFLEKTCGAPREVMTRASRDVRISATRRADVGELKGHLDYYYHLAGHPKQLRSRRAVASALGLSGDW
uniref:SET domain-containing protein n=1 Tax=Pelagomonas calceolata TaxID=35677 RepID=A0A7S3ZU59_9STRA|mmetsp:Transcript_19431/g.60000  ORF Transcript_19431/g.60000 Transcript_19431/m.60000 type:complete len:944 (-) Transcript_19431:53-2884(-)